MIKIAKKQLKDLSISLNAYYCGGNVYNHENISYWLSNGDFESIRKLQNKNNDIEKMLVSLNDTYNLKNFYNCYTMKTYKDYKYYISRNQIAYSSGIYGNTGQIVEYSIVNTTTNEVIYKFYTYYC